MMQKWVRRLCFTVLSLGALAGCDSKQNVDQSKKTESVIMAKLSTPVKQLYFNGTLQPLSTVSVLSPVEGRVVQLNFDYGQDIEKGEKLVVLSSQKLSDDFHESISNYLQKKEAYINGIESFRGATVLYKAGAMNRQEFVSAQTTHDNNRLSFYQSRVHLEKILQQVNLPISEISKLKANDAEHLKALLGKHFDAIPVSAPGSGVALFPVPGQANSSDSDSAEGKSLHVGSKVNEGQLMISIGDLSGYSMLVKVGEVDVNLLKAGMPVSITGDAFPGMALKGKIRSVSKQAEPTQEQNATRSVFDIMVSVPDVQKNVRNKVHVGMSAKVSVSIKQKPQVMLPVTAVLQRGGKSWVLIEDASGKRHEVSVETGMTTMTEVVVTKGVKPGDRVVIYEAAH